MSERAEWIKCIRKSKATAFCGRLISMEWAFVDFEHAQRTEAQGGRLVPCADCYDLAGADDVSDASQCTQSGSALRQPDPKSSDGSDG
jgi:hypothetical protein